MRQEDPSDTDLMIRIAGRDRAAFALLFERYAGRVKGFAMSRGMAEDDADEIAQDVMVQVWRRAETYDPTKAALTTWLFTIARNRRIDKLRRMGRAEPDPNDPMFQPDPEPDGQTILSARERQERVIAAMAGLSEDQREVVRAAFFDGLTHAEIATEMALPLGTVKSRLRLAFKALRDALGDGMIWELRDD